MSDKQKYSLVEEFLNYKKNTKKSKLNTIKTYANDLNQFMGYIDEQNEINEQNKTKEQNKQAQLKLIDNISLIIINNYLSSIKPKDNDKEVSSNTIQRKITAIQEFFKYLKKHNYITENIIKEMERPKTENRKLPVYLSLEEAKKLLSSINGEYKERNFCIITLFLNCGLRLSELININIDNIRDNKLSIIDGKGGKDRQITLNATCIKAINEYLKVRPNIESEEALFVSEKKNRMSNTRVQEMVKNFIIKAGLNPKKYSVHSLRHTFATLTRKYGKVDIRVLQKMLGHSDISTTSIYTHIDDESVEQAFESNPLNNVVNI